MVLFDVKSSACSMPYPEPMGISSSSANSGSARSTVLARFFAFLLRLSQGQYIIAADTIIMANSSSPEGFRNSAVDSMNAPMNMAAICTETNTFTRPAYVPPDAVSFSRIAL